MRASLIVLALLISPAIGGEATLTGRARVLDGDTLAIGGVSVRLKGVAAPERKEPGGSEATQALRSLAEGVETRCELTGETTHRRAVGFCTAAGRDLNREMVTGGYALPCHRWDTRGYAALAPVDGTAKRAGYTLPDYCLPR